MKPLKYQIRLLKDLRRQHELVSYRYYTRECQATVLELIADEIHNWPSTKAFPHNLYVSLAYPDQLATKDIGDLCLILKETVLCKNGLKKES